MPTIQTNRLSFHYRTHGDPSGLPLLLLHGSYGSSRWWEPLFELLPDEIYCIAPDLRGCGQSDKPDSGYTIEEQAEDLAALIEALQLRDFSLLAHSTSGAIAMEYIINHPNVVSTLILVDSVPAEGVFTPLDTIMLLDQMRTDRQLLASALTTLMPTLDIQHFLLFPDLVEDAASMASPLFTGLAESLNRWNRFGEVRHLTLPTLLLWGELDEIVDKESTTRTLIAIPGAANLEILPYCGHSPMLEAPLVLAERIVEFITQDFTPIDLPELPSNPI
ncbi:MAG: alpha/beta hydrolase [Caldilineaceae bacterium]